MPGYSFAGLNIYADGDLPLPPGREPWDLFIKQREFSHKAEALSQDAGGLSWGAVNNHYALRAGGVDFVLRDHLLEVNRPLEAAADMIVRAALGFVAVTRGLCSFHGSAAARGGSAVLIVGNKGAGKSTTVTGSRPATFPCVWEPGSMRAPYLSERSAKKGAWTRPSYPIRSILPAVWNP